VHDEVGEPKEEVDAFLVLDKLYSIESSKLLMCHRDFLHVQQIHHLEAR
jgi:hypothetical protein